jgi:repressor LexA
MLDFGKRLRKTRKEKDLTLEQIAEKLNITYVTMSRYEKGQLEPKFERIVDIANILGVTPDFLLGLTDDPNKTLGKKEDSEANSNIIKLPVLGKISAGIPALAVENIEGYKYVAKELLNPHNEYFYLRVSGDSMNLKMQDGDKVLVQRQNTVENGEIAVVMVNGYDAVIKKVIIQDNIIQLLPMSTNPEHLPQIYDMNKVDIKIIGKATYVTSKL